MQAPSHEGAPEKEFASGLAALLTPLAEDYQERIDAIGVSQQTLEHKVLCQGCGLGHARDQCHGSIGGSRRVLGYLLDFHSIQAEPSPGIPRRGQVAVFREGKVWGSPLAGGGWWVAVGSWRVVVGGWRLVGGGWWVAGGGWWVAVGGWRVAVGGWRLVGGS